eukprot:7383558-Prymnesium_polylepis.1
MSNMGRAAPRAIPRRPRFSVCVEEPRRASIAHPSRAGSPSSSAAGPRWAADTASPQTRGASSSVPPANAADT